MFLLPHTFHIPIPSRSPWFTRLIIYGQDSKSCSFLQAEDALPLWNQNDCFIALVADALSQLVCSFLKAKGRVPPPCIEYHAEYPFSFRFVFLESRREDERFWTWFNVLLISSFLQFWLSEALPRIWVCNVLLGTFFLYLCREVFSSYSGIAEHSRQVLCCVVLCFVVLCCCVVLCCVVLCCVVLCCAGLCSVLLGRAGLCCVVLVCVVVLCCTGLCCVVLGCAGLGCCAVFYWVVLRCAGLYWVVLCCAGLCCVILGFAVLCWFVLLCSFTGCAVLC